MAPEEQKKEYEEDQGEQLWRYRRGGRSRVSERAKNKKQSKKETRNIGTRREGARGFLRGALPGKKRRRGSDDGTNAGENRA